MATYVLIHGAIHSGWYWHLVDAELRQRGHEVVTMDLPSDDQRTYDWPVEIRDAAFHADGAPTAGPPPFHIFALAPATAYGFATDETFEGRSTRWRFFRDVR